jgi:hypothetical protein
MSLKKQLRAGNYKEENQLVRMESKLSPHWVTLQRGVATSVRRKFLSTITGDWPDEKAHTNDSRSCGTNEMLLMTCISSQKFMANSHEISRRQTHIISATEMRGVFELHSYTKIRFFLLFLPF